MAAPGIPNWQGTLLSMLGYQNTPQNQLFLTDWQKAEGGNAANNPFNTTEPGFNATGNYNSVGVKSYGDPTSGLKATAATLRNGRYGNILSALQQGNNARAAATALANSPWGTGSLVLKMLGGAPTSSNPKVAQLASMAASSPQSGSQSLSRGALLDYLSSSLGNYAKTGNATADPAAFAALFNPQQQAIQAQAAHPLVNPTAPAGNKAASVVAATKQYLGTPYVWGGESPKGFDCSGLLQYVWKQAGVNIPRTTYQQFQSGRVVPKGQLQPGDAVFFTGSDPQNGLPGHVGMYIGNGKFIEAPHTGAKVQISNLAGYPGYAGARRYT